MPHKIKFKNMKSNFKLLITLILPFFSYAQDKGLDQIIDEKFGQATGWFVDFIFLPN